MKEIYEHLCKEELTSLRFYEQRIKDIPLELAEEQAQLTSIKSATSGAIPVQGGGNRREEWLVNTLERIEVLKAELRYAEGQVRIMYMVLETLPHDERRILEVLYIDKQKKGAERLCGELDYLEERTVWNHRKTALKHYSLARHGAY